MARLKLLDDGATIALFLLALALPSVAALLQEEVEVSETEFRTLAPEPRWRWKLSVVDTWPAQFGAWYDDHFPARSWLLERFNWLRFDVYGVSPTDKVVVGREEWLYLTESLQECAPLAEESLARFAADMEQRRAWLEESGIRYLFVAVPDKTDLYPEYLPGDLRRKKESASRIALFCGAMAERTRTTVLDLTPALQSHKQRGELLYFRNDPHWNYLGAYVGYQSIVTALGAWFPSVEPVPWELFGIEQGVVRGGGLARMMGLDDRLTERTYRARPTQLAHCAKREDLPGIPYRGAVRKPFATECAGKPLRVLVFRDSYGTALTSYLSETFGRTAYVWERPGFAVFQRLVRSERPDVVVEERVSHYLSADYTVQ